MSKLIQFPSFFGTLAQILSSNVVLYMCMARALCEYVMSHHGSEDLFDFLNITWFQFWGLSFGGGSFVHVLVDIWRNARQMEWLDVFKIIKFATGSWKCCIFFTLFWTMTSGFMYNLVDLFKDMQGKNTHTTEPLKKGSQTMVTILAVGLLDFFLFVITIAFNMITFLRVYRPKMISWVTNTWDPSDLEFETFCNGYNWAMLLQVGLVAQMIWRDPWVVLSVTVISWIAYTWAGVKIPCWRQIANCVLVIIIIHSTVHMEIKPPQLDPNSSFEVAVSPCKRDNDGQWRPTEESMPFKLTQPEYDKFTTNGMCQPCDILDVVLVSTLQKNNMQTPFCNDLDGRYHMIQTTSPKRIKIFWVSASVESEDTFHKVIACVFLLIFLWNEENVWYYLDSLLHTTSQQGAPVAQAPQNLQGLVLPPPPPPQQPAPPPVIQVINTAHPRYLSSSEQTKKNEFLACRDMGGLIKFHDKHLGFKCGLTKQQKGETKATFLAMRERYKRALNSVFTTVKID